MSTKWIQLANLPADIKLVAERVVAQIKSFDKAGHAFFSTPPVLTDEEWRHARNQFSAVLDELNTAGWEYNLGSRFKVFRLKDPTNKPSIFSSGINRP